MNVLFRCFRGFLFCSLGVAIIDTTGCTFSSLYRLPEAVIESYRALRRTNIIGPNLKVVISILLPAVAVCSPFLIAIGSIFYGIFKGFLDGLDKGVFESYKNSFNYVQKFHNGCKKLLVELNKYEHPVLADGETPFDIRFFESIKALLSAAVCAPIESVSGAVITTIRYPQLVIKIWKTLIEKNNYVPLYFLGCLATICSPLLIPFIFLAGICLGVFDGCHDGYTAGFVTAVNKAMDRVRDFWRIASEFVKLSYEKE